MWKTIISCWTISAVKFRRMLFLSLSKARFPTYTSLYFFLGLVFVGGLVGCARENTVVQLAGRTMGTTYHVKVVPPEDAALPQSLQQQIDETLNSINQSMSTYIGDSELSRLNQAPVDTWIDVSRPLLEVLLLSREVSEASGGSFDVTAGPLVNLWGFGPQKGDDKVPDEQSIRQTMGKVGYGYLEIDADQMRVRKAKNIYVDLSAVAKGYAADVVAEQLKSRGLKNTMVEIGGELRLSGYNAEGELWRIGIEKPNLLHKGALQAVELTDAGMATSGDYRNYFEVEGERYSHTIDPSTGRPIKHTLASVTVIADTGAKADAYATALNVLGPEKGFELATRQSLAAYFIVRNGESFTVKYTPEFKRYLVEL